MPSRLYTISMDAHDPTRLAEFWAALLGGKVEVFDDHDDEVAVDMDEVPGVPDILFIRVPDAKTVKNRVHFDLAPDDQAAEVERALSLGARHVDIGQRDVRWVVLADPEGNEFCILTPR